MFIVLDLVWSHFAGSGYIGKVFERPIIGCLYLADLSPQVSERRKVDLKFWYSSLMAIERFNMKSDKARRTVRFESFKWFKLKLSS